MKIYTDDQSLPYKTTKLRALYTKSEIDAYLPSGVLKMFIGVGTQNATMFLCSSR